MFKIFQKYSNIISAVSEKKDGTMKLSAENRRRFFKKFGIKDSLAVRADLVHKNNIEIVSRKQAGKIVKETDALITADKSLFLTITVADCLPIFIFDPEKEIIGLVHAGWRNLAGNILEKTIRKIHENFGSLPENILIGIGPGISQCHFEIKEDVLRKFKPYLKDVLIKRDDKTFLDLKKIAEIQLTNLGVKKQNIEISPECTFCLSDKYFSFRRDKSKRLQTMIAIIGRR